MTAHVGIVLISHSRALAEGAAELARQMGVGEVEVRAAGGAEDGGLGTSLDLLEAAVSEADQGAGVVVIADLGSSVLTTRTLLEDREEGGTEVVLADAPFVEGAVAAASAAAGGADVAAVTRAASEAWDFRKT
ncbi:dihydroxyacetone kinase phosphoryl donor subunit DhaM [Actinoallomurus iriomotensis]|uniref:phosphoenolpyruvate--glycerone phosphotransferase n=1 Tax=Actinoallomurus iriomotensis TaxID=478107 RepID=A0A9W6W5L1_9ACTN|nr:dihydroxyacetone kinase phosphoryl donor subunit DhaM [Actinoallomurus iriomotensis]GLY91102.1 PTS fructose transporter subunit IIA [Actinoallomurus iriomotensis]